jgi:hypothetical protein
MAVTYENRRGQTYYLHTTTTKTGKTTYHFSQKKEGKGKFVDEIPEGFEIYEDPKQGQVHLRRTVPQEVTAEEVALVAEALQKTPRLRSYRHDVKGRVITILEPDQNIGGIMRELSSALNVPTSGAEAALAKALSYSPVLRFELVDEEQRLFAAERMHYTLDDWIPIGDPDTLAKLVRTYVIGHLGKDSFFDLAW